MKEEFKSSSLKCTYQNIWERADVILTGYAFITDQLAILLRV